MRKEANSPNLRSVFADIVESESRKALYDVFIASSISSARDSDISPVLLEKTFNEWLGEYNSVVNASYFKATLTRLRNLEIAILMYRSIISPSISIGEMKLSRNGSEKSYAFVRAPFFAPENVKNEIRVYMGTMKELVKPIEELRRDTAFLERCEKEVVEAMTVKLDEHIEKMKR